MRSKREQTEIFLVMILSWLVYAFCQGDFIVPAVSLVLVFPSYLKQLSARPALKSQLPLSWRSLVSIAIVVGGLWRNFLIPPENSLSFIPIIVPALQTASILITVLSWYRFDYRWRSYYLKFLPWLTVALSINVPFNAFAQLMFWLFCFTSVGLMIAQLYFPVAKETAETIKRSKSRNPLAYVYPIFLTLIALGIFSTVVKSIKLGDDIFMRLIQDYVGRRDFNLFDSTLNLSGSGMSRVDLRPIMDVSAKGSEPIYLIGQVFEEYDNGVWKAPDDVPRSVLPVQTDSKKETLDVVMFEYLADVIPVPRGVVAMSSKGKPFEKDGNGIVFNLEKKIPRTTITLDQERFDPPPDDTAIFKMSKLTDLLAKYLPERVNQIVGNTNDPTEMARKIETYFRSNFKYDLYVDFHADDRGLLYMLDRKRPAYCSYFASAMALMLRERGIPSRLVAGFLATERASYDRNKLVVRGRDAHAWVEALLPVAGSPTGLKHWVRFDPTPADSRLAAIAANRQVNFIADWIWCSQKRAKAALLEIETKTLVSALFIIIVLIVLEEILKKFAGRLFRKKGTRQTLGIGTLTGRTNPYQNDYQRLEEFLKNKLKLERSEFETDAELLLRLKQHPKIPKDAIARVESFLHQYHWARFGITPPGEIVDLSL